MENYIQSIIDGGEGESIKFFLTTEDKEDLARHISAIANTSGGKILIGIRKNGKIAGTEPSESFSAVMEASNNLCIPPVEVDAKTIQCDYKIVLEVTIPKSITLHKVIELDFLNLYIRHKNNTIETNPVLKRYLELQLDPTKIPDKLSNEALLIKNTFIEQPNISMTQLVKTVNLKRDLVEHLIAVLLIKKHLIYTLEGERIVYKTA